MFYLLISDWISCAQDPKSRGLLEQFGKFKPLLNLALKKLYDIFFISIKFGKGWILIIDQNNVNPI